MTAEKPKSLQELWTEQELCKRLALPIGKSKSTTVSAWIRAGLRYIEVSGKRFFWEGDIIEYLLKRQSRQEPDSE